MNFQGKESDADPATAGRFLFQSTPRVRRRYFFLWPMGKRSHFLMDKYIYMCLSYQWASFRYVEEPEGIEKLSNVGIRIDIIRISWDMTRSSPR